MQNSKVKKDFTEGPIFFRIFLFAIPIMLTGILQVFYNIADNIVVGRYSGDPNALAAVGSTGSLTNLVVNFLMGIAVGTSVVVAQFYGAKRYEDVSKAVHTSIAFSGIGGLIVGAVGVIFARQLLTLMKTNPDVIDNATLYITIIFCGVPASSVYNFGATILRAIGDSRSPLIILSSTGIVNVCLNLVFVIKFGLGVAGVAIATIVAQYISAIVVIIRLYRSKECYQFRFGKLHIHSHILGNILRIGVPSGIQGSLFALSNVTIQSAVNSFPVDTISGNTVGSQIEGLTYTSMNSFYHSAITFTGQNYGANKPKRVTKTLFYSLVQVAFVGLAVGFALLFFAPYISGLFTDTSAPNAPAIIEAAINRLRLILPFYFLCGMMEVLTGYLRGTGCSFIPMISSLVGSCVLRIVWIAVVFPLPAFNRPFGVYITYPISWALTCLFHVTTIIVLKLIARYNQRALQSEI